MPFAVELGFDEALSNAITELMERLETVGVGLSLRSLGFTPHLSLATCQAIDEDESRKLLRELARQTSPFPIAFEAAGAFPPEGATLFLVPATNLDLIRLHRTFWESFVLQAEEPSDFYTPERWVPHCTVARDVPPAERARALVAALAPLPLRGRITEVGLTGYRPAVRRFCFPLSD